MRTTTTYTALDHIPDPVRIFLGRRSAEAIGIAILVGLVALGLALLTWSIQDPSLNHATGAHVRNWLGAPGAIAADLLMQLFGLASLAILVPLAFGGWRLVTARRLPRPAMRGLLLCAGAVCASGVAALLPITAHWPLPTGLGGVVGDVVMALPRRLVGGVRPLLVAVGLGFAVAAVLLLSASVGLREHVCLDEDLDDEVTALPARRHDDFEDEDDGGEPGLGLLSLGALIHAGLSLKGAAARRLRSLRPRPAPADDFGSRRDRDFDAPFDLAFAPEPLAPSLDPPPRFDATAYASPAQRAAAAQAPRDADLPPSAPAG